MNTEKAVLFYITLIILIMLLTLIFSPSHPLSLFILSMLNNNLRWLSYELFSRDLFSVLRLIFIALILVLLVRVWRKPF